MDRVVGQAEMTQVHGFVPQTELFCTYTTPCTEEGICSSNDFLYKEMTCSDSSDLWKKRDQYACSRIDPTLCPAFSNQEPINGGRLPPGRPGLKGADGTRERGDIQL